MPPKLSSCLAALVLLLALPAGAADTARTTLTIRGMTCGGCVATVKLQLKRTEGVTGYEVSLARGEAAVSYDPTRTDPKKIAESVSRTGFEASVKAEEKKGAGPTSHGALPLVPRAPRG